jgi:hypothetical protein
MIHMVCGKWPLELGERTVSEEPKDLLGSHFAWINDKKVRYNADAFLDVLNKAQLPTELSVVEFCGGIGEFTLVVQNVLKPTTHRVFDLDQECVDHLKVTFPQCQVEQGDARKTMKEHTADFVLFDPPRMRAEDLDLWPIAEMLAFKPRYVVIGDTVRPRVALHRALHSKFFSLPVHTYDDYLLYYNEHLREKFGYRITAIGRRWYSWLLLEPSHE